MLKLINLFLIMVPLLLTTSYSRSLDYSCQKTNFCTCTENENRTFSYICKTQTNQIEQLSIDLHTLLKLDEAFVSARCDGSNSSELFKNLPKLNHAGYFSKDPFLFFILNQCRLTETPLVNLTSNVLDITNAPYIYYTVRDIKNIPITRNYLKDLFEDLKNLRILTIVAEVEFLPLKIFSTLSNLQIINLTMPIKNLESYQWSDSVDTVIFQGMRSRTFPNDLFVNKSKLQKICYKDSSTFLETHISENMFQGSDGIQTIELSGNQLRKLPNRLFYDQTKLHKLILSHNNLSRISDILFIKNKELFFLDLSYNHFDIISSNFPREIMGLRNLLISNNLIEYVVPGAFDQFKSLEALDLSSNNLKTIITRENLTPIKLQKLDLSKNKIFEVTLEDFKMFIMSRELQTVDLQLNKIERIKFDCEVLEDLFGVRGDKHSRLEIVLGSNSFICDCEATHLLKVYLLKVSSKSIIPSIELKVSPLICEYPNHLNGRRFIDLTFYDLACAVDEVSICPSLCSCSNRTFDQSLLINCSGKSLEEIPNLPDLASLYLNHIEIDLSLNNIKHLPSIDTDPMYNRVTKLTLNNNQIRHITLENIPEKLTELYLKNNRLVSLDKEILRHIIGFETLNTLSLSGNPWRCDCDTLEFLDFVRSTTKVTDIDGITCPNKKSMKLLDQDDFCPKTFTLEIIGGSILIFLTILIACAAIFYSKFNYEIKVWLFARACCMCLIDEDDLEEEMKYDAFIAFATPDLAFLIDHLVPQLESGEFPYKLCLHERDWIPGHTIHEQYRKSIVESRKTIIILSNNFLQSIWGMAEFREANALTIKEQRPRIIIIMYEDVGPIDQLDKDLQRYIKLYTYLKWGDENFWPRLKYALRHPISMRKTRKGRQTIAETIL